jgi:hypothetical protein
MRDEGTGDHVRPLLKGDLDAAGLARVILGGLHVFADGVLLADHFAAGAVKKVVKTACKLQGRGMVRSGARDVWVARSTEWLREGRVDCGEHGMVRREGRAGSTEQTIGGGTVA